MRIRPRTAAGTVIALTILWGEWENWRASRRLVGPATGPTEAVVVLGYRNPGPRANAMNRWRVRAGLRSLDPSATASRLILCGGACAGTTAEATLMADYATGARGYRGTLMIEQQSRTTWENIAFAIPYLEDVDRIKIASLPFHAERGRRYLTQQRPDLATRLVRGADYRFGEWMPLKPLLALHGRAESGAWRMSCCRATPGA